MHKNPTYIGVFSIDSKKALKELKGYSKQCLAYLAEKNQQQAQITKDLDQFEDVFNPPKDNHHITTAFLGKNPSPKIHKILKNFKYEEKIPLKINLCVYVIGYIIVGFSDISDLLQVDNEHPHVTLFLSKTAKAVQSNDILAVLFKQRPDILKQDVEVLKLESTYKDRRIYIVKKQISIDGITGDNFRNGKR